MNEHDRLIMLERDVAHIDKTLSELKSDMKSEFSSVRGEIRVEINGARGAQISGVRGEMNGLRGEINGLRTEMNTGFSEVNRKFDAMHARLDTSLFWTLGMFGTGVLGLAAFMYFLFSRIPIPAVEAKAGVEASAPSFLASTRET